METQLYPKLLGSKETVAKSLVGNKSAIENSKWGRFSHKSRLRCVQISGLVVLERDLLLTLNHRVVGSIPTQPTSVLVTLKK